MSNSKIYDLSISCLADEFVLKLFRNDLIHLLDKNVNKQVMSRQTYQCAGQSKGCDTQLLENSFEDFKNLSITVITL